jgi:GntR family transcriptional repressor for pyruvate dehydrogenase complex
MTSPESVADQPVRSAVFAEKVEVPRAADVLVQQLRAKILAGELPVGEFLPPERALVEQTGLGRVSVREALRILEVEQLIEPRYGRHGGWLITRPGPEPITRSIDIFLRGQRIQLESILETREALEPSCAMLAARNRTELDIEELEKRGAQLEAVVDDVQDYLLENLRWHLAVVEATHSELLIAFVTALSSAIHAGSNIENFNSPSVREAAVKAHAGVFKAIREQDETAAFRRMYRHLHAFRLEASKVPGAPNLELDLFGISEDSDR